MRIASILSIVIVALSSPAFAEDADLRKQVDQISSAFAESFDKQDAAGLAALFATDYIIVNQFGPRKDVAQLVEGTRKAGFDHEEITVDQVWPLGSDTALGTGQVRFTGKEPERSFHRSRGLLDRNVCSRGREMESSNADGESEAAAAREIN